MESTHAVIDVLPSGVSTSSIDLLLRCLETGCRVVQVIELRPNGLWREVHRGGLQAHGTPLLPCGVDHAPAAVLNWLAASDVGRVAQALQDVHRREGAWRGAAAMQLSETQSVWIDVEIHAAAASGEISSCVVVARDRDHSRETQAEAEAFRQRVGIVEAAVEFGIVEYDAATHTVQLDDAAAALHGLSDAALRSLSVDDWAALAVHDDQQRARTLLSSGAVAGQTERATLRFPGRDAKKPRLLELSLRAAADGNGGLVGACRDVTRERSLEALRRQKITAERASQAKSEFMSHVSHELRTPLNAILGFAQLMSMDPHHPLAKPHRDRLEMVQHSGKRLLGLIDQLLQITKIERGKATLRAKPVNVRAVTRHCIDALELMALARGVEIIVDIERPELSAVRADPEALEQVMTNLLSNAIKYNRERGRVRITFRAGEVGEITVDDTGNGLSDSQLGRMFEPFDRLDAERSAVPGNGLGLVITKQLVEAMGGKLDVWSQVGRGSRFKVELPLARGSRDTTSNSLPLAFPSQWDTGREYSVLYVEDDEVNVILMEQLFATQPEWRLQCATTGAEGITAAVRQSPHLILLDMNLPDMEGAEVFRRLKGDPRTSAIPCVAVSADALPAHIERVHSLGFEDYWTKPLDLPSTVGKLKRLLV